MKAYAKFFFSYKIANYAKAHNLGKAKKIYVEDQTIG